MSEYLKITLEDTGEFHDDGSSRKRFHIEAGYNGPDSKVWDGYWHSNGERIAVLKLDGLDRSKPPVLIPKPGTAESEIWSEDGFDLIVESAEDLGKEAFDALLAWTDEISKYCDVRWTGDTMGKAGRRAYEAARAFQESLKPEILYVRRSTEYGDFTKPFTLAELRQCIPRWATDVVYEFVDDNFNGVMHKDDYLRKLLGD